MFFFNFFFDDDEQSSFVPSNHNIGEWSEVYALLKLLADGRLYMADANTGDKSDSFYEIIKILRQEKEFGDADCLIELVRNDDSVKVCKNGEALKEISIEEFAKNAEEAYATLTTDQETASFAIPSVERFMHSFYCQKIKAASSEKADITIRLHDPQDLSDVDRSFSIKSQIGGDSTLINASAHTNFVYEIVGTLSDADVRLINSIQTKSKLTDRIKTIYSKGARLQYAGLDSIIFKSNLRLLDGDLDKIVAQLLLYKFEGYDATLTSLCEKIATEDPLGLELDQTAYEYKVRHLLSSAALGMVPGKKWKTHFEADGGYIIVKEDGDVLCYHIHDSNILGNYLLRNTKLDAPSSGRHGYGSVYEEGGILYIKLNLQVRFVSPARTKKRVKKPHFEPIEFAVNNTFDQLELPLDLETTHAAKIVEPWPIEENIDVQKQFSTHLPVYSVKAICGTDNVYGIPTDLAEGWVNVSSWRSKLTDSMFVVHAIGNSMEPMIHDGDLCVFDKYTGGSRNGYIVLTQRKDQDDDYSCNFTIKKYESKKDARGYHEAIRLLSLNKDYEPIQLPEVMDEAPYITKGILLKVLAK